MSLEIDFPNLTSEGFRKQALQPRTTTVSPGRRVFRMIGGGPIQDSFHFGRTKVPRMETLAAFQAAFTLLGYENCADGQSEVGFEKVAFYLRNGKPTHAARQLPDGMWTSKLGPDIDINHTLRGLEGPAYGQVVGFMRRPSSQS